MRHTTTTVKMPRVLLTNDGPRGDSRLRAIGSTLFGAVLFWGVLFVTMRLLMEIGERLGRP